VTPSLYDLRLVNTKVNLLPYNAELVDDWKPAETEGDCDSYATAKQWRLVHAYGWPETAARLACCFVEPFQLQDKDTGEWRWATKAERYHLVLLADFGQTYVLDNRHPLPMEFDMLPYEWHKFWSYDLNDWEWAQGADRTIS
jgi:predicted transglutaminase-like cysteine proteinase